MENSSISQGFQNSPIASSPNAFPWVWSLLALGGAVVLLLGIMFVGCVQFFLVHGYSVVLLNYALTKTSFGVVLQGIAELAVIIYLLFVVPALAHTSLAGLGFRTPSSRALAYIGAGIVLMFVVVTALSSLLTNVLHAKAPEEAVQIFLSLRTVAEKASFGFFAGAVAPVWEEFVFRIFLFNALFRWWGFWPAAIVSSVLFGAAHAQQGGVASNIAITVPLAAGGFVLCWLYATTRNAWACILTHGIFNLISLGLLTVAPQLAK